MIQSRLDNVQVQISVEIGTVSLGFKDIMNLKVGNIIKMPKTTVREEFTFKVEERAKFKCRPGRIGSRLAVQIGEPVVDIPDELLIGNRSEEEG
jgi:flagellar motor switch protein FliM